MNATPRGSKGTLCFAGRLVLTFFVAFYARTHGYRSSRRLVEAKSILALIVLLIDFYVSLSGIELTPYFIPA